jgi:hypothetical protein
MYTAAVSGCAHSPIAAQELSAQRGSCKCSDRSIHGQLCRNMPASLARAEKTRVSCSGIKLALALLSRPCIISMLISQACQQLPAKAAFSCRIFCIELCCIQRSHRTAFAPHIYLHGASHHSEIWCISACGLWGSRRLLALPGRIIGRYLGCTALI